MIHILFESTLNVCYNSLHFHYYNLNCELKHWDTVPWTLVPMINSHFKLKQNKVKNAVLRMYSIKRNSTVILFKRITSLT